MQDKFFIIRRLNFARSLYELCMGSLQAPIFLFYF